MAGVGRAAEGVSSANTTWRRRRRVDAKVARWRRKKGTRSTSATISEAFGSASQFLYGKHWTSSLDNTHKNRVVGRLDDAGMSKRNAESLVQEASTLKAEQFRGGPGSLSFIGHEHITKAAERLDSFRPRKERRVDYKGFDRKDSYGGSFDLIDGDMKIGVEYMGHGKFKHRSEAQKAVHLDGAQAAVD